MATTVIVGNTYRLSATFSTWAGAANDVTSAKLKIYDANWQQIGSDLSPVAQGSGVYTYDYTIPPGTGTLYFEFSGTLEGTTALARGQLERKMI
jgi:hypothetical protein